jgi:ribosome-binding protein aMBF1 (putative translation factor)
MTATVRLTPEEVHTRRRALGWSQNELARRIKKDPGHTSRVLRGYLTSAIVWRLIDRALSSAERAQARRNGRHV